MSGIEDDDGFDDEFDHEFDDFSPVPHPDDRLWRHPAEIAAELAAARAAAENPTVELPAIDAAADTPVGINSRTRALSMAAALALVGASAFTIATLTGRSASNGTVSQVDSVAVTNIDPRAETADGSAMGSGAGIATISSTIPSTTSSPISTTPAAASRALGGGAASGSGPTLFTAAPDFSDTLRQELAPSLARIQAATSSGMREGSGFFLTSDGHIVTSAQLVAGADYVLVWTADGGRFHAEPIAHDDFSDVAVLHVAGAPAPPVDFGEHPQLGAGHYALGIDNESFSMTVGSVASLSATGSLDIPGDPPTRLLIEPGMAPGSAIVDERGVIIGLVNATDSSSHATPAWMVARASGELLKLGAVSHPWVGLRAEPTADHDSVTVTTIIGGSPAEVAGLRAGDRIDAVAGTRISAATSFWTLVQQRTPGDEIDLAVTRNGERRLIRVELGGLPEAD